MNLAYEKEAMSEGYTRVAGVDEAGRGPLAGPVVAAAVILPENARFDGLTDSKKLTEKKREELYTLIHENAVSVSSCVIDADIIDSINILQASLMAMRKAVDGLDPPPDCILVDGNRAIDWAGPQKTIVKGDSLSLSISAASVVAKVERDRLMTEYARVYPAYGFERHKGYAAKDHRRAIEESGPCPIHRKTFRGVWEHLPAGERLALNRQMDLIAPSGGKGK